MWRLASLAGCHGACGGYSPTTASTMPRQRSSRRADSSAPADRRSFRPSGSRLPRCRSQARQAPPRSGAEHRARGLQNRGRGRAPGPHLRFRRPLRRRTRQLDPGAHRPISGGTRTPASWSSARTAARARSWSQGVVSPGPRHSTPRDQSSSSTRLHEGLPLETKRVPPEPLTRAPSGPIRRAPVEARYAGLHD